MATGFRSFGVSGVFRFSLLALSLAAAGGALQAGSTGSVALFDIQGGGAGTANGDFISAGAPGLATYYRYFIEVPPGVPSMTIQLFDADIGIGGVAEANAGRDRARGSYNTSVTYSVFDPTGTMVSTTTLGPGSCPGCDNAWASFPAFAAPAAGHWELRIDESFSAGDDINAVGVRAHDGDATGGGIELPMYYHSYTSVGIQTPVGMTSTVSRDYTHYPYIDSGCTLSQNDFDWDSATYGGGFVRFTNRTSTFTQTATPLSGNDVWQRINLTGYTSDFSSTGYGLWTNETRISSTGDGQGNYGVVYVGKFNAPALPPTAQPEANTFRVYLPTDALTKPVKPYVEQLLTHVSGPNPPVVGMTSVVSVTIRIVNPTTRPIVFSAPSRLVTANVPGAGAVYGGNAQFTLGTTLISQPAVGGTGNVVWNPGTVAAGGSALLAYRVSATPPAGRTLVTGVPGANGTTAVYLDETGNAAQARATQSFGPMCGLAVTPGVLTHSLVTDVVGVRQGAHPALQWHTAGEERTLGFNVYRLDPSRSQFQRVNADPLPALLQAQGGWYRFIDASALPGETYTYLLEELESPRGTKQHGPYQITFPGEVGAGSPEKPAEFVSVPGRLKAAPDPAPEGFRGQRLVIGKGAGRPAVVKMSLEREGLYWVAADQIAEQLEESLDKVQAAISQGQISIRNRAQEVAWLAGEGNGGLFFFGEPVDSLYTRSNAYWLRLEPGTVMGTVSGRPRFDFRVGAFPEQTHFEVDAFPATVISPTPESDYWYWQFLRAGDPVNGLRDFEFDLPGLARTESMARLTIRMQSATDNGTTGEHQVAVRVNSNPVGSGRWDGISAAVFSFDFPQAWLSEFGNQLQIESLPNAAAGVSIAYIDSFDLSYRRRFEADDGQLVFTAEGLGTIELAGLDPETSWLLDITNPLLPRRVIELAGEGGPNGPGLRFKPAARARRYLAVSDARVQAPDLVGMPEPTFDPGANIDYLIVAPEAFMTEASRLAAHRRRGGFRTGLASVETIMDSLNDGLYDPRALRRAVREAFAGAGSSSKFLVLAGAGSLDYRNIFGLGGNLVPPLMTQTAGGLYASDSLYGDLLGDDGVPEVAVGRIPARTAAELEQYVDKLIDRERRPGPSWAESVALLADRADGGADFAAESRALIPLTDPRIRLSEIYLQEVGLDSARGELFRQLNLGLGLLVYSGHGGPDRFAAEGLLTVDDLQLLQNGARLPVIFSLTCLAGRFEVPGLQSLGELLVNYPNGGASAVLAPSGLSLNPEAHDLAAHLLEAAFQRSAAPGFRRRGRTVGEVVQQAFQEFSSQYERPDLIQVYNLLGDPAAPLEVRP